MDTAVALEHEDELSSADVEQEPRSMHVPTAVPPVRPIGSEALLQAMASWSAAPSLQHERPSARKVLLQQYEGTVESVDGEEFTAYLRDLTGNVDKEATFDVGEITPEDRARLQPGAIFYWNLGRRYEPHGQMSNYSEFVFRTFPLLSRRGRDALRKQETSFAELFGL